MYEGVGRTDVAGGAAGANPGLAGADLSGATETGTTTVALRTEDGVVMAADRRATLGGRFVTNKRLRKIEQVHPTAAVAMAGSVGGMQDFVRTLRAEAALYASRRRESMSMDALATLAGNVLRNGPYVSVPTLAGADGDGPRVFDLDSVGGVVESDYVAKGSGMQLAYGVLEQAFEADLEASNAREVAARAVGSAVERDTASGNGLLLAEVTDRDVRFHEYGSAGEVA